MATIWGNALTTNMVPGNSYTIDAKDLDALICKHAEKEGIEPKKEESHEELSGELADKPIIPSADPKWQDVLDVVLEELGTVLTPKSIIHNRKTGETIVIWRDGKKTTVTPRPGTEESPYFAFVSALAKKVYGSNSKVNRIVDKTFEPTKRKPKKESSEDIIESMGDEG